MTPMEHRLKNINSIVSTFAELTISGYGSKNKANFQTDFHCLF